MAQNTKNLFPLGIATGAAHCNRTAERTELKDKLRNGTHTWLWARRRMGKTSLIEQVLVDLRRSRPAIPSVSLDLNVVHDAQSLEEKIRTAAAALSLQLTQKQSTPEKLLSQAFAKFKPEFTVGGPGLKMTLRPGNSPATGISDVLLALDAAAKASKRRAVFVMDEFQQLSGLFYGQSNVTLEGAIRHAVERAEWISYVFSGSQRSLLADLFENPDRPLFRHCSKMVLQRIEAKHYAAFMENAAKARWRKKLPDSLVEQVLDLSRRHPYYVNALCNELWLLEKMPNEANVTETWTSLVGKESAVVAQSVRRLSATQRAMLVGIAQERQVEHPTGREFLARIRLSVSTGGAAKKMLEEEDLIRETEQQHWELIDPVMEAYLRAMSLPK